MTKHGRYTAAAMARRRATRIVSWLEASIERSREELTKALVPGVARRPPREWFFSDGRKPDRETCRQFVSQDLARAFGRAEQWLSGMEVHLRFKGVTYETLNDHEFLEAAVKAGLDVARLHEEFSAAKAASGVGGAGRAGDP